MLKLLGRFLSAARYRTPTHLIVPTGGASALFCLKYSQLVSTLCRCPLELRHVKLGLVLVQWMPGWSCWLGFRGSWSFFRFFFFVSPGGCPYPRIDRRKLADLLQQGYRMPKPAHLDDENVSPQHCALQLRTWSCSRTCNLSISIGNVELWFDYTHIKAAQNSWRFLAEPKHLTDDTWRCHL